MVEANWNKGNLQTNQFNTTTGSLPLNQQQGLLKGATTTSTTMQPVLEKVEKIVHKDVLEREHIIEDHKKDIIEVHEQPIQKRVLHPEQQVHIQEQSLYETQGSDNLLERDRLLEQMRLQDRNRDVIVEEREDLRLHNQAPTVQIQNEFRKEIIEKPIVTEIHEQPITEVHERNIFKTVHETPSVSVVREAPIVQNVSFSSQPLMGSTTTMGTGLTSGTTGFIPPSTTGTQFGQPMTGNWQQQSGFQQTTGAGLGTQIKNKIKEKLGTHGTTGTTFNQQPLIGNQQPLIGNQQPLIGNQQPLIGNQRPLIGNQQPLIGNQQPLIGNQQPLLGNQQPLLGNQQFVQQPPLVQKQPFIQQPPLVQQQPFVQQPLVGNTVVEKGLADSAPHFTSNSGINPLHGTRK